MRLDRLAMLSGCVLALLAGSCAQGRAGGAATAGSAGGAATPGSAGAGRGAGAPFAAGRKLTIIGINDTHGWLLAQPPPKGLAKITKEEVGGADWFAGWVTAIRADARSKGGDVVVLDAGDLFQGTLISNQFQGKSVIDCYNAIGVAAAAVGNHEFDFGMPVLKERMAQAQFPILSANIFLKGTDTRPDWAKPTTMIEVLGTKVGIIGLTTTDTPTSTNPVNVAEFEFRPGGPIAARLADELRAQGATIVLITAHAGPKGDNEIQHIAEAVKGKVDAINSGHHHEAIGPPLVVANIPIVQSGSKLTAFSVIELTLDAGGHVTHFAVNDGAYPKPGSPQPILHTADGLPPQWRGTTVEQDGRVAGILRDYDVQVKKLRESLIGETKVALRKGGKDDLLANLAADALRSGAGGALKADVALQNSGGLRVSEIGAGPITFGQIFDLYPFDNQQVVVTLQANQLRNALEGTLRAGKAALRVSGLRYTVDWDKFGAGADLSHAPPGSIVTQVMDDAGKLVCETEKCEAGKCSGRCATQTYTVSVTDFLANGGDGLTMLKDAPKQIGNVLARDIIVAYVKQHTPLSEHLLGGMGSGAPQRITTIGSSGKDRSE